MAHMPIDRDEVFYQLALSKVDTIGVVSAKKLIRNYGSAKEVFTRTARELMQVQGLSQNQATAISSFSGFDEIEKDFVFAEKKGIEIISFLDKAYPNRLTHCGDSPVVLFKEGNANLSAARMVSIVGTRSITDYGRAITRKLLRELQPYNVTVVSGLAYGVDIEAHTTCLELNIPTIGVLGHGLDKMYPNSHTRHAREMVKNGALLTEFGIDTQPDRENFPKRNRIVAGMTDATIVIESGVKGGSIITAELAADYNRDVFAVPGDLGKEKSEGCNRLIKTHRAALLESAKDLEYIMGWTQSKKIKAVQQKIFVDLNPAEEILINLLREKGKIRIDEISLHAQLPTSMVMVHLLNLELNGLVRALPGKVYEVN